MNRWRTVGFVYHALSFRLEAPGGYARCTRCGQAVSLEQFTGERCPGPRREPRQGARDARKGEGIA